MPLDSTNATSGQIPLDQASAAQQDAFALTRAALGLQRARSNPAELAAALDHNVELWVAIRTLIGEPGNTLPQAIRGNLVRLSEFVFATTLRDGVLLGEGALATLININLQLAEGLLKGHELAHARASAEIRSAERCPAA